MTVPKTLLRPTEGVTVAGGEFGAPRYDRFGNVSHYHRGQDFANTKNPGVPILASQDGLCRYARSGSWPMDLTPGSGGYGNHAVIEHEAGNYATLYAHFSVISVKIGQRVVRGQVLGLMGETGYAMGRHLHFEVIDNYFYIYGGTVVNPSLYFGDSGVDLKLLAEGDMTAFIGVAAPNGIIAVAWITNGIARRKMATAQERAQLAKVLGIPATIRPVTKATLDALPIVVK